MKKCFVCLALVAVVCFSAACVAWGGEEEDAKALAQKGAAHIKAVGKEKAIADIMNPSGDFRKGKLFLTVNDFAGVCLANGAFPKLVGQNHFSLKDPNGKYFIQEAISISKTKGGGWLEWSFTNPETKKLGPRKGWVQKVEGMDMFVMAPLAAK